MTFRQTPFWLLITLSALFWVANFGEVVVRAEGDAGEVSPGQADWFSAQLPMQEGADTEVKTSGGVTTVAFKLDQGKITVFLPDDISAGDTISGTVLEEPKGRTSEEQADNKLLLDDLVIDLEGTKVSTKLPIFTWTPPAPLLGPPRYALRIMPVLPSRAEPRAVSFIRPFVLPTLSVQAHRVFEYPPSIGQPGRTNEISGSFDGKSSNTTLKIGGVQITPLAESPRKIVFVSPPGLIGPAEITIRDGDYEEKGTYRSVKVNLSAPKTNLSTGETTTLKIQVSGLEGIKTRLPLTLESRGVIATEGGSFQRLLIQPSEVTAEGNYTTTRAVTGVQAGGWTATATVVTQPFDVVLRDPNPPKTLLLNSFTGEYFFCSPELKLSGRGQIKSEGCNIQFTHTAPDRNIQGTVDSCDPIDNGRFYVFYAPGTDVDFTIRVTDTHPPLPQPRSKIPTVHFHQTSSPRPPVQDVNAFATCP